MPKTHHQTCLHTPWLWMALSLLSHSCTSCANTNMSCASQLPLVTPCTDARVFVSQRNKSSHKNYSTLWCILWTQSHVWKLTKSCKVKLRDTHACRHKSQGFYKGSDGLKEDLAGYYGMPGICWGKYWPACLSMQSLDCVDCTLSLSHFSPYLSEKNQQK